MKNISKDYSLGDKVMHRSYGLGQIDGIENKPLNGVIVECFKVTTKNGVYWFPTANEENPRVHPVASEENIQKAIDILRSPPDDFDIEPLEWKVRIDDVNKSGDFLDISRLVRDLFGLKMRKKLNRTQSQALDNLEGRLLSEWAASLNVDSKSIQPKLNAYLQASNMNFQNSS